MSKNNRPLYRDLRKVKISVIGDVSVGKTCLAARFTRGDFLENTTTTIADIMTKKVDIDGQPVLFQVWDTAGFERYRSLLPMYLRDVIGIVLVYNITDKRTFDNLGSWLMLIAQNTTPNVQICLVGNKKDLHHLRDVSEEEAKFFAEQKGMSFFETSAKTGDGVPDVFHGIAERMLKTENLADKHRKLQLNGVTKKDETKTRTGCC